MQRNLGCFIVGTLLLITACASRAQDLGEPILLVAAPGVQGVYERAVLVAIPTSGGHAGMILNRSKDVKLASVLPSNPRAAKVVDPVRFGGPLGSKVIYAMVRRDPGNGAKQLVSGVFLTTGSETIDRIVDRMPEEARFFAGLAVWLPDELQAQIEAGEWIVGRPDAATVFHRQPEAMWAELLARLDKTRTALK